MPHRKPCVREDSWREKEAASERRRRKRGRPAFEAATSVWHTSQSVCAPNQESHRERLEGRRYVSHEAQWPRTRRRPGSWCWGAESTNTLLKTITLTRKQGQSALHVLSRSRGLGWSVLDFLDGLGEEGAGMSVERASSSSASQMLLALGLEAGSGRYVGSCTSLTAAFLDERLAGFRRLESLLAVRRAASGPVVDESLPEIFAFGRSLVVRVFAEAEEGSGERPASGSPTGMGVAVPHWPEASAGAVPAAAHAAGGSWGPETRPGPSVRSG